MSNHDILDRKVILVVDDDKIIRDMLRHILEEQGREYDVIEARTAEEALSLLDKITPSIILCDILMPGMNGFEFCNLVKTDELKCDIPFVFISSKSREEEVMLGLELGANEYVTKPFNPKEMAVRVKTIINRYRLNITNIHHPFRLKGSLMVNSVSDMLQVPSVATRHKGTLVIHDDKRNLLGALYIQEGKIINATYKGEWGSQSAYRLINTKAGSFTYFPGISKENIPNAINKPIVSVILAAADAEDKSNV